MKTFLLLVMLLSMFAGASEASDSRGQIILSGACLAVLLITALLYKWLEKKEEERNV